MSWNQLGETHDITNDISHVIMTVTIDSLIERQMYKGTCMAAANEKT